MSAKSAAPSLCRWRTEIHAGNSPWRAAVVPWWVSVSRVYLFTLSGQNHSEFPKSEHLLEFPVGQTQIPLQAIAPELSMCWLFENIGKISSQAPSSKIQHMHRVVGAESFLGKSFWHLVNNLLINCLTFPFLYFSFFFLPREHYYWTFIYLLYAERAETRKEDWTGVEVRPVSKLMKCGQMSQAYSLKRRLNLKTNNKVLTSLRTEKF